MKKYLFAIVFSLFLIPQGVFASAMTYWEFNGTSEVLPNISGSCGIALYTDFIDPPTTNFSIFGHPNYITGSVSGLTCDGSSSFDTGTYMSGRTAGNYTIIFGNNSSGSFIDDSFYGYIYWTGSTILNVASDDTHIVEILPARDAYITPDFTGEGATTTISVSYYINAEDVGTFTGITVWVTNDDRNQLYGFTTVSPYSLQWTSGSDPSLLPTTAGSHTFEYEVWLPNGGYTVHARLQGNFLGIVNPFTSAGLRTSESQDESNPVAQYHYYTVGEETYLSNLRRDVGNELENVLSATSTASSTPTLADCNPLSWDTGKCMTLVFLPTSAQLKNFGDTASQGILNRFPLGYAWNFIQILQSSATTSIPAISATLPNGVVGAGATIDLTIDANTLDWLWNATTSTFTNESAPDERTLLEIIGDYWNIVVYVSVGLYLASRILGSHLIGSWYNDERRNSSIFGKPYRTNESASISEYRTEKGANGGYKTISKNVTKSRRL